MAKDTISIINELWQGFGNNPANTRTFDAMANMLPPLAVYRGGKTLGGVPDKVSEGDYSGAAVDALMGALDVAPAGVLVRPAGRAIKAGAKGAAPIVDDLLSGYMDATGMVLNAAPKGPKGAGKAAAKAKKPKAVGNVFDPVTNYEEAKRMANAGAHLKRQPNGDYVGAPIGVDSPQALGRMRTVVDGKVVDGAFNGDWYDRARDTYSSVTGYDPATMGYGTGSGEGAMASLFSRGGAAYSPQATPAMETGGFLAQHNNKVVLGNDVIPRTRSQAANVAKAYIDDPATGGYVFDPALIRLGKKTGPYADAKDATIPDSDLYKTANDIWHGRVFGYKNNDGSMFSRGFTPQEHGFLTGENVLASERATAAGIPVGSHGQLEWTPRRMQAATWGAERFNQAKADNIAAIEKAQKALAKWEKTPPAKRKGAKPVVPKMKTDQELLDYAKGGIDQTIPAHIANANYEFIPGQNTGHMDGLISSGEQLRRAYSDNMASLYGNRDPFYDVLQMYSKDVAPVDGSYLNSAGVMENNPGFTVPVLAETRNSALKGGKAGGKEIGDASRAALDDVEFVRTVLNANEAGAWNKFTPENSMSKRFEKTGVQFAGTQDEASAFKALAQQNGLDVIDNGETLVAGRFPVWEGPQVPGHIIQKWAKPAIQNAPGGQFKVGRMETGYQSVPWGEEGSGVVTQELADRLSNSLIHNFGQRLDNSRLPGIMLDQNDIDRAFAAENGFGQRQDIYKLRELLADPRVGFAGLQEYIKKHGTAGLPAAAIFPLSPSSDEQ